MKQILRDNIDHLEYKEQETSNNNVFILKGTQRVVQTIDDLKQLNFLTSEIAQLKSLKNIYYSRVEPDEIQVSRDVAQRFRKVIDETYTKTIAVLDAIDQAIPDQEENSISIRLPDYTDLEQLQKFFNKLNHSLGRALNIDEVNGSIKIQNFDSGSLWIELVINGGAKAMGLVGSLIGTAIIVSKEIRKAKLMQLQIESLQIKNDTMKDMQSAMSKQLKVIVEAETKNLLNEQKIRCEPEDLERMKNSVETLAGLIFEGTRIQPSLNAPDEVAEQFPDFTKIGTIHSSIKQIETVKPEE